MIPRVLQRASCNVRPARDVCQIWSDLAAGRRSLYRVALSADGSQKDPLTAFLQIVHRLSRRLLLGSDPGAKLLGRLGRYAKAHFCVLKSAKFRALSPINSWFVCLEIKCRRVIWDQVALTMKIRKPE